MPRRRLADAGPVTVATRRRSPPGQGTATLRTFPSGVLAGAKGLLTWKGPVILLALAATLPNPEALSLLIIAVFTGVGVGCGTGYAAWLKKKAEGEAAAYKIAEAAKLEVFKAEEEAKKGSTLVALDNLTREMVALKKESAEKDGELATERADRERVEAENERLRREVLDFAMQVLHTKGFVMVQGEPVPEPETPAAGEA